MLRNPKGGFVLARMIARMMTMTMTMTMTMISTESLEPRNPLLSTSYWMTLALTLTVIANCILYRKKSVCTVDVTRIFNIGSNEYYKLNIKLQDTGDEKRGGSFLFAAVTVIDTSRHNVINL
jgi:O-antigen ligase